MRNLALLVALAALAPAVSAPGLAADTWTDPYPGMRHLHRVTADQNIHVLEIDLCAPGVALRATATGERRRTTSSFGALAGVQAAVNGDFFDWAANYRTDGLSMSGGTAWADTADHSYTGPVAFGSARVELVPHWVVAGPASWMREIVSGHPTLLDAGTRIDNNGDPLCTARHPRTMVGLTQDRFTLLVAVVDGRAPGRAGMTCDEMIDLMRGLGAWDLVNLDGGGSSTLWLAGAGVVNFPSGGTERTVANHLGVHATGSGAPGSCTPGPRTTTGARFPAPGALAWDPAGITGARYDVLRGDVAALAADAGIAGATCRAENSINTTISVPEAPDAGRAFYYLVRPQTLAGATGTYDTTTLPSRREGRDGEAAAGCF